MFSELMQRVGEQLLNELPFVIYRKPKKKEVNGIFQHTDQLHLLQDFTNSGFVFAPFDSSENTVLIPTEELLVADDFAASGTDIKNYLHFDASQKEAHIRLVQKAILEIQDGRFQKVVLSRKAEVGNKTNAVTLFQRLLATYDSAFCYLWFHPKIGMWLGATPEILLQTTNRQIITMSLAGTQPFVADDTPSWGLKEQQEQQLVTEYIKTALKDRVVGLKASELETVKAGNLLHLRTKLTGQMTTSLDEIIKALHPTPAVCGLPMTATKNFILANENYDREFYTGFLGELNFKEGKQRTSKRKNQENNAYRTIKTKSELFVNLRCMKLDDKTASIYVGGGVTSASDPDQEWQETVNKSGTMLKILS